NSRSRIDVTVSHRSRSNGLIRRHVSQVPADERTVKEGIPVTSVPRTTFDLAASEDVDTVVAMLREAEHRNLWDRLSLWDLLERYPGRRGSRKVRLALESLKEEPVGRKRSRLEERFAPFLRHHRLPLPRFNDWIDLGSKRYQVDCHWPDVTWSRSTTNPRRLPLTYGGCSDYRDGKKNQCPRSRGRSHLYLPKWRLLRPRLRLTRGANPRAACRGAAPAPSFRGRRRWRSGSSGPPAPACRE
ncbi:MAG TPA: hypothetical protein VFY69_07580, partial [Solirubrobacterales bacterium]|nr:hypothetical protein [Solirubrobacterales bacterium]